MALQMKTSKSRDPISFASRSMDAQRVPIWGHKRHEGCADLFELA